MDGGVKAEGPFSLEAGGSESSFYPRDEQSIYFVNFCLGSNEMSTQSAAVTKIQLPNSAPLQNTGSTLFAY